MESEKDLDKSMIESDESGESVQKNQDFDKSNINYASDEEGSKSLEFSRFKDRDD